MICPSSHFLPCDCTPGFDKVFLQIRKKGVSGHTPVPLRTVFLQGKFSSCLFVVLSFLSAYDVWLIAWLCFCGLWVLPSGDRGSAPVTRALCEPCHGLTVPPSYSSEGGPSVLRGGFSAYPMTLFSPLLNQTMF